MVRRALTECGRKMYNNILILMASDNNEKPYAFMKISSQDSYREKNNTLTPQRSITFTGRAVNTPQTPICGILHSSIEKIRNKSSKNQVAHFLAKNIFSKSKLIGKNKLQIELLEDPAVHIYCLNTMEMQPIAMHELKSIAQQLNNLQGNIYMIINCFNFSVAEKVNMCNILGLCKYDFFVNEKAPTRDYCCFFQENAFYEISILV